MFTPARCTCTAYAAYHSSVRPVVDEQKTPLAAAKAMTRGAVPFNRACVKECALMCNSLDVISEDPAPSRGGEGEQGTQTLESQIASGNHVRKSPCISVVQNCYGFAVHWRGRVDPDQEGASSGSSGEGGTERQMATDTRHSGE